MSLKLPLLRAFLLAFSILSVLEKGYCSRTSEELKEQNIPVGKIRYTFPGLSDRLLLKRGTIRRSDMEEDGLFLVLFLISSFSFL